MREVFDERPSVHVVKRSRRCYGGAARLSNDLAGPSMSALEIPVGLRRPRGERDESAVAFRHRRRGRHVLASSAPDWSGSGSGIT
jgi:hypothetical protein